MDNFEEALNKAKEVATAAYKKTEEVLSVQKQRLEIATLNSKLKDAFATLGETVYNQGIDLSFAQENIEDIEQLKAKISSLQAEIRKTKYKEICSACGKEIEKDTAFCSHCGAKQER